MKKILISLALFLAYFAYRVHFWEDYTLHGLHALFNSIADTLVAITCGGLIFYLNGKSSFIHRWIFPFSVLTMTAFSFVLYEIHRQVYIQYAVLSENFKPMFESLCFQILDSGSVVITGALAFMLHLFSTEKKKMQDDLRQMANAKDKAELNYLKSRIEPHFVFNGLNCIYHEIDKTNTKAKSSILQFSDIMRYHLQYASCEKVNFDIEYQYLQSYINFQFNRTSDFLDLTQEFKIKDAETEIEPLLILPFIENAFKYCSGNAQQKGKLDVKLEFDSGKLVFEISNTYDAAKRRKMNSNGFGLENVMKRLRLLYPGRFKLRLEDETDRQLYYCQLEIAI